MKLKNGSSRALAINGAVKWFIVLTTSIVFSQQGGIGKKDLFYNPELDFYIGEEA